MERMDDEYARRAAEVPALRKRPSEYVRSGRIYFSCEADEWLLPQAVKLVGENQIVYASDFPHWDHSYPDSLDELRNRGDLTADQQRKILDDNTRRLYGL
jgi:predicted TIM-barrel fold metal-dependent hydrolase